MPEYEKGSTEWVEKELARLFAEACAVWKNGNCARWDGPKEEGERNWFIYGWSTTTIQCCGVRTDLREDGGH